MPIPPDSTIASIFNKLADPKAYIPATYGKLHGAHQQHPPAFIRIGCQGEGMYPNYRIECSGGPTPLTPFNGKSHQVLANADSLQEENWSTKAMSYEELQALLTELHAGRL